MITPSQLIGIVAVAKRAENPKDPFVWPLVATIFWSLIAFCVMITFFPFLPGEGAFHLIALLFIIGNNWAFWRAYFVAKQKRED
jgi:hypothetical protein